MKQFLFEENSELKNRIFPIPDGVRNILQQTLENYNGDKTVDGYKRLNNLLNSKTISYSEMKRIKNFFDNYIGTNKSTEFILNGGEPMKTWVNNTLFTARKAIQDFKQAKKDAGIENAFIKHHEKNRQSKKTNKPTANNIKTNNLSNKMMNGTNMKYESIQKHVIVITESQLKNLKEAVDNEFSFDELSNLKSFKQRVDYCTKHLGKSIGKGSSRLVFQYDDNKVLKLAWNQKGVAQNNQEEMVEGNYFITPQIFDNDINDNWILSEFVLPAKKQDFEHCLGLSFEQFCSFIYAAMLYRFNDQRFASFAMSEDEYVNLLEENEYLNEFDSYIGDNGKGVCGDMTRLINYGLTQREGQPTIVLLDSGLNEEIFQNYYSK